jgi:hypothetical protein
MVTGEAGIGKTAVLERFGEMAQAAGCHVTWGRGWHALDRLAYGPWAQVLGGVSDVDLRDGLTGTPRGAAPPGPGDAETAQARRHEAVVAALLDEGGRRPLVLAMDDVQWFDPESVLLLAHVVPRLIGTRVLLVGTVRDTDVPPDHPLRPVLDTMRGTGAVLPLHGLGETAVAATVEALTGQAPDPTVSRGVRELTGGNPLFVRELVRLLMSEERLEELTRGGAGRAPLPVSVREVLDRRLAALSPSTSRVLRALAVLGPEPVVPHLAEVAGVPEAEARRALVEASTARLLVDGVSSAQPRPGPRDRAGVHPARRAPGPAPGGRRERCAVALRWPGRLLRGGSHAPRRRGRRCRGVASLAGRGEGGVGPRSLARGRRPRGAGTGGRPRGVGGAAAAARRGARGTW